MIAVSVPAQKSLSIGLLNDSKKPGAVNDLFVNEYDIFDKKKSKKKEKTYPGEYVATGQPTDQGSAYQFFS